MHGPKDVLNYHHTNSDEDTFILWLWVLQFHILRLGDDGASVVTISGSLECCDIGWGDLKQLVRVQRFSCE